MRRLYHALTVQMLLLAPVALIVPALLQAQPGPAATLMTRTAQPPSQPLQAAPQPISGSTYFLDTPRGRAAAYAFQAAAGRQVAQTRRPPPELGETQTFNTITPLQLVWRTTDFVLKAKSGRFHLWVEAAALSSGEIDDAAVADLAAALDVQTPPGSVNPGAGILENTEALLGPPPNIDGDGIVDVLWFDIIDDFAATGIFFPGFIMPDDYNPNAPPGAGNHADVLYLDINPLLTNSAFGMNSVQETVARVYADLIHFSHDPDEALFVFAGTSQWATLQNGYPGTNTFFLEAPQEHNVALFSWAGLPGDPQRAGQFTTYLAEQFGMASIAALLQDPAQGMAGYENLLATYGDGRTLPEVVLDYHIANWINDAGFDARWGYTTPARQAQHAAPSLDIDASLSLESASTVLTLLPGAVQYVRWDNVAGLALTVDTSDPTHRDRVQGMAVVDHLDGSRSAIPFGAGDLPVPLPEGARYVTAVIAHTAVAEDAADLRFDATWTGTATPVDNIAYDAGLLDAEGPNFFLLGPDWQQAVRFDVPAGLALHKVFLAPYYTNQFAGSPVLPFAPRDFTLNVWADDGSGEPGALLLAVTMNDPRPFAFANSFAIDYFAVDLLGYTELDSAPSPLYLGLSEAGTDDNVLMMAMAPYDQASTSLLYGPLDAAGPAWHDLWSLQINGEPLNGRTFPVRAQFRLPEVRTDAEAETPFPAAATLQASYPNPFRGRTTIPYALARPEHVRLTIYDVLGREVSVLVDALMPAGHHTVAVEADGWAAGLYLYRLETPGRQATGSMVHLR